MILFDTDTTSQVKMDRLRQLAPLPDVPARISTLSVEDEYEFVGRPYDVIQEPGKDVTYLRVIDPNYEPGYLTPVSHHDSTNRSQAKDQADQSKMPQRQQSIFEYSYAEVGNK